MHAFFLFFSFFFYLNAGSAMTKSRQNKRGPKSEARWCLHVHWPGLETLTLACQLYQHRNFVQNGVISLDALHSDSEVVAKAQRIFTICFRKTWYMSLAVLLQWQFMSPASAAVGSPARQLALLKMPKTMLLQWGEEKERRMKTS